MGRGGRGKGFEKGDKGYGKGGDPPPAAARNNFFSEEDYEDASKAYPRQPTTDAGAAGMTRSETDKQRLKIAKKIREIEALEEKAAAGTKLQATQVKKIEEKEALMAELAQIDADIAAALRAEEEERAKAEAPATRDIAADTEGISAQDALDELAELAREQAEWEEEEARRSERKPVADPEPTAKAEPFCPTYRGAPKKGTRPPPSLVPRPVVGPGRDARPPAWGGTGSSEAAPAPGCS